VSSTLSWLFLEKAGLVLFSDIFFSVFFVFTCAFVQLKLAVAIINKMSIRLIIGF